MVNVSKWLSDSCLHLNVKKTVCMFFTKTACNSHEPDVYVSGERLQVMPEYKYLGIYLDSNLSFKKQVKNVAKVVKFQLFNFKYIRNSLTTDAAKLYFNVMIIPFLTYCLTSWAQASSTTLKSIQILHKQALKVLDNKPKSYHHCAILTKHSLLSWDNLIKFFNISLVFKVFHNMAPPPLREFIKQNTSSRQTRSVERGDCVISYRKSSFSQSAFSIKAAHLWNALPLYIRTTKTCHSFKLSLKNWLLNNQLCEHES